MYKVFVYLVTVLLSLASWPLVAQQADETEREPDVDIADVQASSDDAKSVSIEGVDIPLLNFAIATDKPTIDGVINDEFWLQAERIDIDVEMYPERFSDAIVSTDVAIAFTSTHIFVAYRAFDPDISQIRTSPRERDGNKDDDYVSLILDPIGNGVRKYEFRINPSGSLSDVLQDTVSDRYIYDWNTKWTGAATINDEGWSAEIAIPFQSIKFPEPTSDNVKPWFTMLKRSYPRRISRTFGKMMLVQQATEVVVPVTENSDNEDWLDNESNVEQSAEVVEEQLEEVAEITEVAAPRSKLLQVANIVPHYVFHLDQERSAGGSFSQEDDTHLHDLGLHADFKFGTSKTLALAINPHFVDVEADIARDSINNSFNIFKPETRSFFQDSGELYHTSLPVVYTRQIVRPRYGVSYSSTASKLTSGLFVVNDRQTELYMPDNLGNATVSVDASNTSGVWRLQTPFRKQTVGAIGTFRVGDDGYHNLVGGVDGYMAIGLDDKLRYQVLYSHTEYPISFAEDLCEVDDCTVNPPPSDPCTTNVCDRTTYVLRTKAGEQTSGHAVRINYKRNAPKSLFWVNYYDVGEDFRADLGFIRRADYRQLNLAYGRRWYPEIEGDGGKSRIQLYGVVNKLESQSGEKIEDTFLMLGEFRGTMQTVFQVGPAWSKRAVGRIDQNDLALGDNAPIFDEAYVTWYFKTSPVARWTFNLDGRIGQRANAANLVAGDFVEYKPRLTYRNDGLDLDVRYTHRHFDTDEGQLYEENFYTLGLTYRQNKRSSHRLLWLHDLTERNLDIWTGFDKDPHERDVVLEYTYTFEPSPAWRVLGGFKYGMTNDDNNEDKLYSDNREVYLKVERRFNLGFQ